MMKEGMIEGPVLSSPGYLPLSQGSSPPWSVLAAPSYVSFYVYLSKCLIWNLSCHVKDILFNFESETNLLICVKGFGLNLVVWTCEQDKGWVGVGWTLPATSAYLSTKWPPIVSIWDPDLNNMLSPSRHHGKKWWCQLITIQDFHMIKRTVLFVQWFAHLKWGWLIPAAAARGGVAGGAVANCWTSNSQSLRRFWRAGWDEVIHKAWKCLAVFASSLACLQEADICIPHNASSRRFTQSTASIPKLWRVGWDEVLHSEMSFSYCIFPSVPPRIANNFLLHYATQIFWI